MNKKNLINNLKGIGSNIQDQLNNKADNVHDHEINEINNLQSSFDELPKKSIWTDERASKLDLIEDNSIIKSYIDGKIEEVKNKINETSNDLSLSIRASNNTKKNLILSNGEIVVGSAKLLLPLTEIGLKGCGFFRLKNSGYFTVSTNDDFSDLSKTKINFNIQGIYLDNNYSKYLKDSNLVTIPKDGIINNDELTGFNFDLTFYKGNFGSVQSDTVNINENIDLPILNNNAIILIVISITGENLSSVTVSYSLNVDLCYDEI